VISPTADPCLPTSRKPHPPRMIQLSQFQNAGFQRGAPAWKEAAWWVARSLCFAPWFPLPSALKTAVLRAFGAKVGRGVVIRTRVNITFPWRLEIGDHVWIGDEVLILSLAPVRIGSNCCLSQRAFLCTGSHDHRKESFDLITRPITLEDGCWVGAGAFIAPGVTLRAATTCAAGAVVVKDAGTAQVIGGNPAKVIGKGLTSDL
jgi:putative colanic acid biosynthesis acetyltransferase WcaF